MSRDEDDPMMHLGEGCMVHGDDHMTECTVCGGEFCLRCHPGNHICPDCADTQCIEDDTRVKPAEGDPDDEDVDQLLKEADELGLDPEKEETKVEEERD